MIADLVDGLDLLEIIKSSGKNAINVEMVKLAFLHFQLQYHVVSNFEMHISSWNTSLYAMVTNY